jgi:hypothetical protein
VTTSTQPVPSGPITVSSVAVSSAVTANIPASFAGLSYEKGALPFTFFSSSNTGLVALFRRLGPGVFRLGGSSVDKTFWNHAGPGRTPNEIAPSDIDRLAAFITATGWSVLYGVNLARSTPAEAADEVAYAVKSFGSMLAGIEIGNEPDLYPGTYFPANWSFADYLALWKNSQSAIRLQSPHVPPPAPSSPGTTLGSPPSPKTKPRISRCFPATTIAAMDTLPAPRSRKCSATLTPICRKSYNPSVLLPSPLPSHSGWRKQIPSIMEALPA